MGRTERKQRTTWSPTGGTWRPAATRLPVKQMRRPLGDAASLFVPTDLFLPLTSYGWVNDTPLCTLGETMAQDNLDLLQGTLDMLLLKALQLEPLHGYAI